MTDRNTLLVIDGHSLAFRAFFALPPEGFITESGQYTNAVHGFLQMTLSLLDKELPTHMAVAFDLGRESFRTKIYPEYKGGRSETPPEFNGQVPAIRRALEAMNIKTLSKTDFEADDILATLSTEGTKAGWRVLLVSGDQDILQLVNEQTTLLYPVKGVHDLRRFDPDAVFEKYGVSVAQFRDYAALKGEVADNLPGIPKVGPVTAAKWLTEYGTLANLLAHVDDIPGKVGENLREYQQNAVRNFEINKLVTDLSLDVALDDLRLTEIDRAAVDEVFNELELRSVGARVRALGKGLRSERAVANEVATLKPVASAGDEWVDSPRKSSIPQSPAITGEQQASGGVTELDRVSTPLPESQRLDPSAAFEWIKAHQSSNSPVPLGINLTFIPDESRATNLIAVLGLATESEAITTTWVVGAESGTRSGGELEHWLAAGAATAPKVAYDFKPQLHRALAASLAVTGLVGDGMLAWYLFDASRSKYSFEAAAEKFVAAKLPTADPNQLIPEETGADAGQLAWFALVINTLITNHLPADAGGNVLTEIELPLLPLLAKMELSGIAVDKSKLNKLSADLGSRVVSIQQQAFDVIGHEVNLASPKQLQQVLFEELDLPKTRKLKTGYSTDAEALTDLVEATDNPFPILLLQHRDVTKLRQMVETLLGSVAGDGRIHTTYQQTGTTTGRLSSIDPNLQNIPVRADEGKLIRDAFVVGAGFEGLLSADYSQIEMRIMAHLSGDEGLIEAFNSGEDLHSYVGAQVFGVKPSEVTAAQRSKVKAMSYGLVYGLSAFGLAKQLRISQDEAKGLMNGYFSRFGGVRDYLHDVVEQARKDGYTATVLGRHRPFPDFTSPNRVLRDNAARAALNAPIQGTAADIMKIAMLRVDQGLTEAGLSSRILLQVHDELIIEVSPGERDAVQEIAVAGMQSAAELKVPLDVHLGFGTSWNAAAH